MCAGCKGLTGKNLEEEPGARIQESGIGFSKSIPRTWNDNHMQPIYFPHTYITGETFKALSACFKKFTVYQPTLRHIPELMIQWRNTGQLEIRCPLCEFETDIESSLKSYQYLGNIHQGRKGEVKNYQPSGIPFFDETSPQKIRADLVREILGGDESRNNRFTHSTAQRVHAGLFLQMAQDFDSHQDGIRQDMEVYSRKEKALFKNLKEDDDSLFQELRSTLLPRADSPGEHMLPQRLSAWTRLFFYDILINAEGGKFPPAPILFITTSRFLFNEMVTEETDHTVFASLDLKVLQPTSFSDTLSEMARTTNLASVRRAQGSYANVAPTAIKIAVVLNEPPLTFLAKGAGVLPDDIPSLPGPEMQPNTLIGLISI
jgi:hypothetical protein